MKRVFPSIAFILLFTWPMTTFGQADCPEYTFVKIVDSATPLPGGSGGTFDGLSPSLPPAADGPRVAFATEGVKGGTLEGVFIGDGKTLRSVVAVGDPEPGGGTIETIFDDFAFSGGVVNIIAKPSSGDRGIYRVGATGLSKIVELGEPAPLGGTFSTIFFVSRHRANLAFQANVNGRPGVSSGVFARIAGVNELVADNTTVIPGSAATTFSGFSSGPDISGENVAFHSGRGGLTGIYARIEGTLTKVADNNDTVPGSVKTFTSLGLPAISGRLVAFRGVGDGAGIYIGDGGPLTVIAQTGDSAPGGSTFGVFGQYVSIEGEDVAFSGSGSGFIGLFVSRRFGLCRVIDINNTLDGKNVTQLIMGRNSYSRGILGFLAVFSDDSRGIYLAKAPQKFPTGALFILLD
jgi:hypothetical protein